MNDILMFGSPGGSITKGRQQCALPPCSPQIWGLIYKLYIGFKSKGCVRTRHRKCFLHRERACHMPVSFINHNQLEMWRTFSSFM